MMTVEVTVVPLCRGGLASDVSLRAPEKLASGCQCLCLPPAAVGGDLGVPGLSGGDDGVQLSEDRRRDDGLCLGGS